MLPLREYEQHPRPSPCGKMQCVEQHPRPDVPDTPYGLLDLHDGVGV